MKCTANSFELITIEEFANRMGVSRTTMFDWKKRGRLKAGRHYIQIGKTVRFEWGPELLAKLHEDCLTADERQTTVETPPIMVLAKGKRKKKGKQAINWDY